MSNENRLQPLLRFLEVLPKSGDLELALLKSHLVIEEVLTEIICKSTCQAKYIHEARLTFHQKCNIARAFNEVSHVPWLWQALKLLNQARNELSHNLTSEELNIKLEVFTAHVRAHNREFFEVNATEKFTYFHMAAFAAYIALANYANFYPVKVSSSTIMGG